MFEIREKPEMVERAMLVSIYFDPSEAGEKQAMLDELEDLVSNLGIGIAGKHLVKSRDMHAQIPVRHRKGAGSEAAGAGLPGGLRCF